MQLTKLLGILGLIGSILVGLGEYFLHYSPTILEQADNYEFLGYVTLENLKTGHFLAIIGIPLYFAGYLHIYKMLESGNKILAKSVLALGFIAFAVGGVWIGSRGFLGTIVHLKSEITPTTYQTILNNYSDYLEVLVQVLRVVITLLSLLFVMTILKGGTLYQKKMAFFNPILILIITVIIGKLVPSLGKHVLPILMNSTHFIVFSMSLYQYNINQKTIKND